MGDLGNPVTSWTGHEAGLLRAAMRLSLREFAARLGIDARTISKWEARGREVTLRPHNQRFLDEALRLASDEVRARFAALLRAAHVQGRGAAKPELLETGPVADDGRDSPAVVSHAVAHPGGLAAVDVDDDVKRRSLLTGAVAIAGGAAVGGRRALSLAVDAWDAAEAHGFAALLDGSVSLPPEAIGRLVHEWLVTPPPQAMEIAVGRQIGENLVAKVERRVRHLRRLDDYVGGRDLQALVERELAVTAQLLKEGAYTEETGRRLLVAIGDLCQLAGWVAADAGDNLQASQHFGMGIKAAHVAGDRPLAANLISTLSYHVTNTGEPQDGILLAETAVAGVERPTADSRYQASATTRALLKERAAWAYACAGQARQAERALASVETDYDKRRPDDDPEWVYWLNEDEINVMAARCHVQLKQPHHAIPLLSSALERYTHDRTREVALYTSWLAEAHLQAGNIDEAAHHATRTAELTAQTTSTRSDKRLLKLRELLKPHEDVAAVQQLMEQISSA